MIIFESILTTFVERVVFRDHLGSAKNWLELKIEPPLANLAKLPKSVKHIVRPYVSYDPFLIVFKCM